MEWWGYLLFLIMGLLVFFAIGLPVAFAFLLINIIGIVLFMGGPSSLFQLILNIYASIATFVLSPVLMFILMGEILFHARMAYRAMDVFEMWMGRIPGRLSLMAIISGTLFSSLTGSAMANVAMLGSSLAPEMQSRGYSKSMSLGPILGSSGIAMMIPPSSLGVILGSLAYIPISKILIGGIVPGFMMAACYTGYVIIRCVLNPSLAPVYSSTPTPLSQKILAFLKHILPLGFIIFSVIGVILLGMATPAEAGALGALTTFIIAGIYGGLNKQVLKNAILGTFSVGVMVLIIIAGATTFSQIMSFTGAARGLVGFVKTLEVSPLFILLAMMIGLLILGCFMEQICMMMITIPIYLPLVQTLGFDTLWFGILILITLEIAATSPPFGLNLFVMKGVAPKGTTMGDIYWAGLPFIACDLVVLIITIALPGIVLWLPSLIKS